MKKNTSKKVTKKSNKEKKLNFEGLKAIISLNWISYAIVLFSLISLFGIISSGTIGYGELKKADTNYIEYVSSEDNYESISKFSFMSHKELIDLAKNAESRESFLIDFVGITVSTFIVVLMVLILFICIIFITHCILKNQEKPFLPSAVKTLDITIGLNGILFSILLIVSLVVWSIADVDTFSFEAVMFIALAELILYAVRYIFNAGAKLQAK